MYIKDSVINEIVINKSRFITYLVKLESANDYKEELKNIKKKHYDATHVCSAFIFDDLMKSSDDGEPSGTAGMPILNVLIHNELNRVACYVVRYFGGIKLGSGGLIRAYSNSTSKAIELTDKYIEIDYPLYELVLDYETANKIDYYLTNNTIDLKKDYSENVIYHFALNDDRQIETILEYTRGNKPTIIGITKVQKVIK